MTDVIKFRDEFYISASSSLADDRTRVLKQGETFAVFSRAGDIHSLGMGEHGLYHEGTRFLSELTLRIGNVRPLLLTSNINQQNTLFSVDLTNPNVQDVDHLGLPQGSLHIFRSKFLWDGCCYERLQIRNFAPEMLSTSLCIHFEADFVDIFEVRGFRRERRGECSAERRGSRQVIIAYRGLDEVERRSDVRFDPAPNKLTKSDAVFELELQPHEEQTLFITVKCEVKEAGNHTKSYDAAFDEFRQLIRAGTNNDCAVETSNEHFNSWFGRSLADLQMMITKTAHGYYPYAGVPWFSTPFGRDGIITALETLWMNPKIARGVLGYLASTQATEVEREREAQPGKILHETRRGELAALGEIPFERYYGSVDSTPLFVLLAGEYLKRTGDVAFIEQIWPNIGLALAWIDRYGDVDGDGFIEYERQGDRGLENQGWKDSKDAVFHRDGTLAEGPIALCEVQGYVYAAKIGAASIARTLGKDTDAERLNAEARLLRENFDRVFWSDELASYLLALDGVKNACLVRTSNAGQCLFSGIVENKRAARLAKTLGTQESFSGWGVRTVATSEEVYNPMSYHNGSIWPHDNALIASGLCLYGEKETALKIFDGLFSASLYADFHRLPELFCGFRRRPGEGPTLYPVACSPQAWASGAVFLLLQSCLGLSIRATSHEVRFTNPVLPSWLEWVRINNLKVGPGDYVDLTITRQAQDVGFNVTRKVGEVVIVVIK